MLGALSHPGLVTLFDAGIDFTDIDAPQVFLVMELVRDFDLRERLRRGPLDPHRSPTSASTSRVRWSTCTSTGSCTAT